MAVFGLIAFLGFDSVGPAELLVLCVVILIVVGPQRLPSAARKAGSVLSNLRRAADEFKNQLMTMDQQPSPPPSIPSQATPPIDIPPETGPAAYGRPTTGDVDPALVEPESVPSAATPSGPAAAPQARASAPRSSDVPEAPLSCPAAAPVIHENPPQKS